MKKILKVSKAINDAFIRVVLFFFYYIVIGVIALFYRLFKPQQRKRTTYWQDVADIRPDKDYYHSAY